MPVANFVHRDDPRAASTRQPKANQPAGSAPLRNIPSQRELSATGLKVIQKPTRLEHNLPNVGRHTDTKAWQGRSTQIPSRTSQKGVNFKQEDQDGYFQQGDMFDTDVEGPDDTATTNASFVQVKDSQPKDGQRLVTFSTGYNAYSDDSLRPVYEEVHGSKHESTNHQNGQDEDHQDFDNEEETASEEAEGEELDEEDASDVEPTQEYEYPMGMQGMRGIQITHSAIQAAREALDPNYQRIMERNGHTNPVYPLKTPALSNSGAFPFQERTAVSTSQSRRSHQHGDYPQSTGPGRSGSQVSIPTSPSQVPPQQAYPLRSRSHQPQAPPNHSSSGEVQSTSTNVKIPQSVMDQRPSTAPTRHPQDLQNLDTSQADPAKATEGVGNPQQSVEDRTPELYCDDPIKHTIQPVDLEMGGRSTPGLFDTTDVDGLDDENGLDGHPMSRYDTMDLLINPKKRCLDSDYCPASLAEKSFDELQDESFDFDPTPSNAVFSPEQASLPLTERLALLSSLPDPERFRFFSKLTLDEWEDCGDWFLERFGALIKKMTEARKERRKMAMAFEEEVSKRYEAVDGRKMELEKALEDMKRGGMGVLKGRAA